MKQRARAEGDKQLRRAQILDAAAALLERQAFADITMAALAREAGLAKGTPYLYFPTKEAVFLAVLQRELGAWFAGLQGRLAALGPSAPGPVAAEIAGSLAEQPRLLGLLSLLHAVLEANVGLDEALAFKRWLLGSVAVGGAMLEQAVAGLPPGAGARALLWMNAVVMGLVQMSRPAPVIAEALRAPDLAPLRIDFQPELSTMLAALLRELLRSS